MAKWANDLVMDAALDYVANNAATMIVCSAQPADRTGAVTTYALADVAVASSDFTKANGDTDGRKATVAAKTGVLIDASGTASHIAIVSATALLYVTTCTSQSLTLGNTVNFPTWDIEIGDPA